MKQQLVCTQHLLMLVLVLQSVVWSGRFEILARLLPRTAVAKDIKFGICEPMYKHARVQQRQSRPRHRLMSTVFVLGYIVVKTCFVFSELQKSCQHCPTGQKGCQSCRFDGGAKTGNQASVFCPKFAEILVCLAEISETCAGRLLISLTQMAQAPLMPRSLRLP